MSAALHLTITPFLVLLLIYTIWIQHQRGGYWRCLNLVGMIGAPLDIVLNYSTVSVILWEFPRKGEYTISMRFKRLIHEKAWRGSIARPIVRLLNFIAPSGKHV